MDLTKVLEKIEEGEWKTMPESDFEIRVRTPKPARLQQLRRQCAKPRSPVFPVGIDFEEFGEVLLKDCVVEWRNLTMDGNPFECTEENKLFMLHEVLVFARWWNQVILEIATGSQTLEDDELGN